MRLHCLLVLSMLAALAASASSEEYSPSSLVNKITIKCKCTGPQLPPPSKKGSLVFVVECMTMGIADRHTRNVKRLIEDSAYTNRRFNNFVLSIFGGIRGHRPHLLTSSNAIKITRRAQIIKTNPGGNCKANSNILTSVYRAAKIADRDSVLILFADGPANDRSKLDTVANYLKEKRIRAFIVKTDSESWEKSNGEEYEILAKQTSGRVLKLQDTSFSHFPVEYLYFQRAAGGYLKFSDMPTSRRYLYEAIKKCIRCFRART